MSVVDDLVGRVIKKIDVGVDAYNDNDCITFEMEDGDSYKMYHYQDCCEHVSIEDIIGDIDDLVGSEILMAEEITEGGGDRYYDDSYTWTFYKFATLKGYVTIRWYGSSNGYYSESVEFEKI